MAQRKNLMLRRPRSGRLEARKVGAALPILALVLASVWMAEVARGDSIEPRGLVADADEDDDEDDDDDDEEEDVTPLQLVRVEDLHFGRIVGGWAPGTVAIDAATGQKTVQGGAINLGGFHSRAEFDLAGRPNAGFVVLLPGSVDLVGGPGTVALTDLVASPNGGALGPDGKATVLVGGILQIGSNQPGGDYSGAFDILVDYQ